MATEVRRRVSALGAPLLGSFLAGACDSAPPPAGEGQPPAHQWLADASAELGVGSRGDLRPVPTFFEPEILGPGAALFDSDGDGDLDVYWIRGSVAADPAASRNVLFRQEADGRFTDATAESGLGHEGFGQGALVADLDNDGDPDVYLSCFGADALFRNRGNGVFAEITEEAGIAQEAWAIAVGVLDHDRDGFLDLFVVNYLDYDRNRVCRDATGRREFCGPGPFPGVPDVLYRNRGDGTFEDVSRRVGIDRAPGKGLGVLCADFDGDGFPDVFVANDGEPNRLWIHQEDGTYRDEAMSFGVAVNGFGMPEASMGVAQGDVDGDGRFDLLLTHLSGESNTLYVQDAGGGFLDRTGRAGLAASGMPWTGFGTALADLDHDGHLDLVVVNGKVHAAGADARAPGDQWSAYAEPNLLYRGRGDGTFEDACEDAGDFSHCRDVSRGLAVGDVDADGDLDLLTTGADGTIRVFRNDAPKAGHWLMVRAFDPLLRRDAIGAILEVHGVTRRWIRQVSGSQGYASAHPTSVHFGLGAESKVQRIDVIWPDGTRESFGPFDVDQGLTLSRGEGRG